MLLPHELVRAFEPGMRDAELVQRGGVGGGLDDRRRVGGLPARVARVVERARQAERDAAVVAGDRGQPVGGAAIISSSWTPTSWRISSAVWIADGLAVRRAHVGLDRVAEAAVGVAVGAQGLRRRARVRPAVEQVREAVALEQAGVGVDEGLWRPRGRRSCRHRGGDRPASVLNETDLSPAGPAPGGQQRGGRQAGEPRALAREVRLVGVAGIEREPREVGRRGAARAPGSAGSAGSARASSGP